MTKAINNTNFLPWNISINQDFWQTAKKIGTIALAVFSALTIVGIPLSIYLIYSLMPKPFTEVYERAIKPEGIQPALEKKIMPKYKYQFDAKTTYYFSDPVKYRRMFRAMYVEIDGKIHMNMIYFSQSQGIGRVVPCRIFGDSIGKGLEENDLDLPIDIQLRLNQYPKKKHCD